MMTKSLTSYPCLKGPKAGSLVDLLALTDTPLALLLALACIVTC